VRAIHGLFFVAFRSLTNDDRPDPKEAMCAAPGDVEPGAPAAAAEAPPSHRLSTGALMPAVGLGTWEAPRGVVGAAVETALAAGYRHLDCAHVYGNEREVGAALDRFCATSGVPRSEIFVTSKLWNSFRTETAVRAAFEDSRRKLGLEYLDLYLIHFCVGDVRTAWRAMETLVDEGRCRAIGVSNFEPHDLDELLAYARIKPAVVQIELHPRLPQAAYVERLLKDDIAVVAYSPLGRGAVGRLLDDDVVHGIARKHGVEPSVVLLRWNLQRGVAVIPKSVSPARIRQNHAREVFETVLDRDDCEALAALDDGRRFVPFYNLAHLA